MEGTSLTAETVIILKSCRYLPENGLTSGSDGQTVVRLTLLLLYAFLSRFWKFTQTISLTTGNFGDCCFLGTFQKFSVV